MSGVRRLINFYFVPTWLHSFIHPSSVSVFVYDDDTTGSGSSCSSSGGVSSVQAHLLPRILFLRLNSLNAAAAAAASRSPLTLIDSSR